MRLIPSPTLPKWAEGDPLRYRQIFENIVSNAVKFTEKGYILVRVSLLAEDVSTYTILTEVYDTGHGVTQDDAQKLFKPFTQLDTPHKKRRPGTGLGLSIAKSLAELLGGNIGHKPNPERQGSIFWFSVKFKKLNSPQQAQTVDALPDPSSELSRQGVSQGEDLAAHLAQLVKVSPTKQILAYMGNLFCCSVACSV
jgi:osomolarity two-component system sensor histidine kinase TcsA